MSSTIERLQHASLVILTRALTAWPESSPTASREALDDARSPSAGSKALDECEDRQLLLSLAAARSCIGSIAAFHVVAYAARILRTCFAHALRSRTWLRRLLAVLGSKALRSAVAVLVCVFRMQRPMSQLALPEAAPEERIAASAPLRHIDAETAVPLDLHDSLLAEARRARGRGQHLRASTLSPEPCQGVRQQLVLSAVGPSKGGP